MILYKKTYFFYITLFIILSYSVYGVGIGQYNTEKQILFQPGLEKSYKFQLSDSLKIEATLEGDLAQYATIIDPSPNGPPRNIEVYMTLPDFLEPGVHILYIVAQEVSTSTATIGGISSVRVGMEVFALYPGKRPLFSGVTTTDVNINDTAMLGLSVTNHGEEAIEQAYGVISIYTPDGEFITEVKTDSKSIAPYQVQSLNAPFDTSLYNLSPGTYRIVGNLTYDNINHDIVREGYFIVGQMKINIIKHTAELFVNSTNKFLMTIESDWSGNIDNVYARIMLPNGKNIKTPNADMYKPSQGVKASAELESYIETQGLPLGPNELTIDIHYKNKIDQEKVMINIIDGTPPEIEKPARITPTSIFITLSIIILVFVTLYFLVFRKGSGRSERKLVETSNNSGQTNIKSDEQYSAGEIRPPTL